MSTNKGIDYGMGKVNIDKENGIRYGVISSNDVMPEFWNDESEPDYGAPHCPKCGNECETLETKTQQTENGVSVETESAPDDYETESGEFPEYVCHDCEYVFGSESAFGDSPIGFTLDNGEYKAVQNGDDSDIFIIKSPYYTLCQFCSPCAPGAGYIMNTVENGVKSYCFGHDCFEDNKAPYPVYSVETGELIEPENK